MGDIAFGARGGGFDIARGIRRGKLKGPSV